MKAWVFLAGAITSEVVASAALKASDGFSRWIPSLVVVVGYGLAFYLLSIAIRTLPLGLSYAIWSGVGTAGAVAAGVILFREQLDLWRVLGILLILVGIVVINVPQGGAT